MTDVTHDSFGEHDSIVSRFAELFEGRTDAYGTEEGGCYRPANTHWFEHAQHHLEGQAIGVFPMVKIQLRGDDNVDEWRVKWGCVDLDVRSEHHPSGDYKDEDECHIAATNISRVLSTLHVTAWIERTRSCGRHVWIFSDSWVSASTMRRALLVACSVAGASTREINPKSEQLSEGQLGNYVRLPYPGALGSDLANTQAVVDDEAGRTLGLSLSWFVEHALAARTSPQVLESIASKWSVPRITPFDDGEPSKGPLGDLLPLLNRAGRAVWLNGPDDGDRSKGLGYVAYQARKSGLPPSDALALIKAAKWQKFRNRPDEEQRLREIVERAWI